MEASTTLVETIERTVVELDGTIDQRRFESLRGVPEYAPRLAEVAAQATRDGRVFRATVGLGLDRLEDVAHVVDALRGTMLRVLSGDLPPGGRELL
jgi:hypothetical protein